MADEDFTDLVDADITRVDMVDKAANGTTFLLAKRADDDDPSLFDAGFVRDLIEKADGAAGSPVPAQSVTISPAALAALVHEAAGRADARDIAKAEYVAFLKAKYDTADRKRMASGGQAMDDGSYPIADTEDLDNAIHAVGRGGSSHDAIRRHIIARARSLGASSRIPDNWAGDGSLQQAVSKADTGPGSPPWEAQDASAAQRAIDAVLAARPLVQALAQREGTEVGAGHMDDLADVCDLQAADDCLMQAAKILGGFQVSERAEAGVAKAITPPAAHAATSPQENTVTTTDTTDGVRKAEDAATTTTDAPQTAAPAGLADIAKALGLTEADVADALLRKAADKTQTPAATEAATESARVIPGTDTVQSPAQGPDDVMKAAAAQFATVFSEAMAPVAKQLTELATKAESQSERVEKALAKPDDRRSPLLNGSIGEATLAQRSPTGTPEFQAILKAVEEMPAGPGRDAARATIAVAAIKARFTQP